jgi:hypothetical protein
MNFRAAVWFWQISPAITYAAVRELSARFNWVNFSQLFVSLACLNSQEIIFSHRLEALERHFSNFGNFGPDNGIGFPIKWPCVQLVYFRSLDQADRVI